MYQISYYSDLSMRYSMAENDVISDRALDRYPAPTGREVAHARHSGNPSLDAYGYRGEWHGAPPAEALAADRADERAAQHRQEAADYRTRPHVKGLLAQDHQVAVIAMPDGSSQYLRLSELLRAARQDDPEGRAVYSKLLEEARSAAG